MTAQSKVKLNKFSGWVAMAVLAASVVLLWSGLNVLKADVFTHYYNPAKHVIVDQNPDTKEVYAWKDQAGNVYTPEDSQVKNFTWGTTALLLVVMLFGVIAYNGSIKYYTKVLLNNEPQNHNYVPRLQ
ncbi:hypothetical protein DCCM_2373 [Desulfocucumis palustris]|uniref:Uncharacterized protein n=1 Tax=Desulfocucumis palustris TaxID=1898651 RepID=A0A2L2XBB0_9FIRM|nr:hypothetical protein [Desulfocucumis palustris]GBF33274.1 hypothetical protein DCCM_2373 [Desulfocucumis palustris]